MRLNNRESRRGQKLGMKMIRARTSLDSIVQYVTMELKLNSKGNAEIQDRHSHGIHDRREVWNHREIQEAEDQSLGPRTERVR